MTTNARGYQEFRSIVLILIETPPRMTREGKELKDCDWFFVLLALHQADEVCIKLDVLIKRGLIPRDRITYKYLWDTVHCLIDPNHQYNPEVVEFFNTIEHLEGGKHCKFY